MEIYNRIKMIKLSSRNSSKGSKNYKIILRNRKMLKVVRNSKEIFNMFTSKILN